MEEELVRFNREILLAPYRLQEYHEFDYYGIYNSDATWHIFVCVDHRRVAEYVWGSSRNSFRLHIKHIQHLPLTAGTPSWVFYLDFKNNSPGRFKGYERIRKNVKA